MGPALAPGPTTGPVADTPDPDAGKLRTAAGVGPGLLLDVVAQVIRDLNLDWSGPTFELVLTGRAPGRWLVGAGAPLGRVTADAVALMRLLSGRQGECDLAWQGDPAVGRALLEQLRMARVTF